MPTVGASPSRRPPFWSCWPGATTNPPGACTIPTKLFEFRLTFGEARVHSGSERQGSNCLTRTVSVAVVFGLLGIGLDAKGFAAQQTAAAGPAAAAPAAAAPAPQAAGVGAASDAPPPLTGPQPQENTTTAADEAAGSRDVTVSFTKNFISDRLPFDVPFNVVGNVDTTVKRLELSVYKLPATDDLARQIADLQRTGGCVGHNAAGRLVSQSTSNPDKDGRFGLFVNALDPDHYYAFCFVGVSPVPSAEFDADVRNIVAQLLPRLGGPEDISNSMLAEIRRAMSGRIAAIGAGRAVPATIPPGNLFDPSHPGDPRFQPLVLALANPFLTADSQHQAYATSLDEFIAAVENASASGTIRLNSGLATGLAAVNRPLPRPAIALTGTEAFDAAAFRFDDARTALDAAVKAAAPQSEELRTLNNLVQLLSALTDAANTYGQAYDRLRNAGAALLNFVALETRAVTVTLGSSVLGADLARSAYVSLDAGIAYPWRLQSMVFYAGTNIYLRPINKAAPLTYKGTFLHRFALTVAVTTTVKDDSRRAEDLHGSIDTNTSNSLMLGAGIRVTPSIRIGAGALVFKESDANPLVNQTSVVVTPYVAFSADVDVARMFRSLF